MISIKFDLNNLEVSMEDLRELTKRYLSYYKDTHETGGLAFEVQTILDELGDNEIYVTSCEDHETIDDKLGKFELHELINYVLDKNTGMVLDRVDREQLADYVTEHDDRTIGEIISEYETNDILNELDSDEVMDYVCENFDEDDILGRLDEDNLSQYLKNHCSINDFVKWR